jgi:aspartyl/glutamyl-tRNA(Asn/Gln) amidotransferase C subunit
MSLSQEQLHELQRLASLDLDDGACQALQADLDAIVDWMAALPGDAPLPVDEATHWECRLRPDDVSPSLPTGTLLQNVPRQQAGFVRVPLFVERET